jgi:hypothetical protein
MNQDLLDSWKEIAAYLGRGVRTVQRWESDLHLPVRRPSDKPHNSIIAFKSELDRWLHDAHALNSRVRPAIQGNALTLPLCKADVRALSRNLSSLEPSPNHGHMNPGPRSSRLANASLLYARSAIRHFSLIERSRRLLDASNHLLAAYAASLERSHYLLKDTDEFRNDLMLESAKITPNKGTNQPRVSHPEN